jgi:hypothetical protein
MKFNKVMFLLSFEVSIESVVLSETDRKFSTLYSISMNIIVH